MQKLVKKEYQIPFILVTSLFFLWGFAHAILDVLNKHFQDVMNISRAHSAWVQVMFYSGYFVMAIPAGLFINKYGYRKGVVFGLLLYGVGSLLFIPGEYWMSFQFFLFSLSVIACGLVFLETAANPYMTELGERETAASRLNLAQSFNGLGCICGPLVGGLLLFSEEGNSNISLPYTLMGILVLAVALVFSKVRLPEIVHEEDIDNQGQARGLWSHKLFIFGIAALFCYEIAEISINSFFINYVVDDGWMNARDASVVLSFGGLGLFMCGRFAGSWVMRKIRAEKVLFFCAVGTVVTSSLIVLNLGIISLIALFLGYAFEAIMFPTIFALSLRGLGNHTKRASSYLMMSPIGGAVGPLVMGYVADQSSMSFSFIVPLLSFIVVMMYAWKTLK
ncbi:sugar MFS transporter [Bacteroides acidifaciens]|uniref:sugar MFS transporter n=1 Tax=Bacteroides acidifaciens TaxID=85831 RepID=UPI00158ED955|nr:sugar MFS transporter [Bacteroides acidifaciens]